MYYATEVEYSALRNLGNYENEHATIKLSCDESTDPLKALAEAKRLVNLFLDESKVVSSFEVPEGDGAIIPNEPVRPVIENR